MLGISIGNSGKLDFWVYLKVLTLVIHWPGMMDEDVTGSSI